MIMARGELVKFMSVDMYKQLTQAIGTMGSGSDILGLYDLLKNHQAVRELFGPF